MSVEVATKKNRRFKDLLAANFGNVLEWFDWNIYTLFAPFFATQFFYKDNPTSALLSTLAVFAVGFIARPIGGWLFGRYADKAGRKQSLFVAMLITAAGSLVIGLSPTYDALGIGASVILVCARLLQGLAHGGEMGTSVTYLVERASPQRRGLFGASSWISVVMGTMLATITSLIINAFLTEDDISSWGWRIPFIIGGALGLYAVWLRRQIHETEAFQATTEPVSEDAATPAPSDSIFAHWRGLAVIFGVSAGGSLMFYTWLIYLPTYARVSLGQDSTSALSASLMAQAFFLVAILIAGVSGDRFGRKPQVIIFGLAFVILPIPLYNLLDGSFISLLLAMMISLSAVAALFGVNGAIWAESLPTRHRAAGVAATLSAATALFGGTAPYLNTWLSDNGHGHWFQYYLMAVSALTLLTGVLMKETKDTDLER